VRRSTEAVGAHGWAGAIEVFGVALGLGLTSFGGPIAHIGYFERTYVRRLGWLAQDEFLGLVALCQMVPGPASSQLGWLIGLRRAGWGGALAAWLGFTLPSALLMFGFAMLAPRLSGVVATAGLHGLKLVAVPIVAQAVWSMGRSLCTDRARIGIALAAAIALLALDRTGAQLGVLVLGALAGAALCRHLPARVATLSLPVRPRVGIAALAGFCGLMVATFAAAAGKTFWGMAAVFFRSGGLVFGGGHVVLPLLRGALVARGWLPEATFLAGYGAAQAVPGPLFTFAGYLGAALAPVGAGWGVAALWSAGAVVAIFLPGLLLAVAGGAIWDWAAHHAGVRGAMAGVNAAVVGVLGATLWTPVATSAIATPADAAIAAAGLILLERWRAPPIAIVAMTVGGACLLALWR